MFSVILSSFMEKPFRSTFVLEKIGYGKFRYCSIRHRSRTLHGPVILKHFDQ